jgi:predicted phage-related endonuclease
MSPEEAMTKTVEDATPGKKNGNGWESSNVTVRYYTDEFFEKVVPSDKALWPEFADIFTTPAFSEGRADHQHTTQKEMEDFIAKKFEQETGKKVRRESRSILNDKYPWAIANYDRLIVGEDAGLECKFTDSLNLKKYKNGEYPERFYAQCVHYLAVSGKKRWYLAVLIGNKEFKWFCIERDEEEIAALMGEEEKMSVCIKTNTPPAVDGLKSTSDAISTIYPDSNADIVSLMAYETDIMQYLALKDQIDALKEQQDAMANRVKSFMNEAGKGESNRYKVSWLSTERKSFDTKAFQADHKEIDLNKYYKTSSYRTFRVTEKGAK